MHYVYVGMKDQLDIRGYEFTGYASKIKSLASYYRANMDLLQKEIRDELFQPNRPIYTKVRDEVSAKYGLDAKVSNSLVADGCVIDGEVENSIIFRGVRIAKGACVKNSIIMQSGIVGENVLLDYVITDKDVTITDSRSLMGYKTYPVYIAKGSRVPSARLSSFNVILSRAPVVHVSSAALGEWGGNTARLTIHTEKRGIRVC